MEVRKVTTGREGIGLEGAQGEFWCAGDGVYLDLGGGHFMNTHIFELVP